MPKSLESFTILRGKEGFILQIEDEDGDLREFTVSLDQLELMAEEIEREFMLDDEGEDDAEGADEEGDEA